MTTLFRTFDTNGRNLIDSRYLMYGFYGKYSITRTNDIIIPIRDDEIPTAPQVGTYAVRIGYIDVPNSISPVLFVYGGKVKSFSIVRITSTTQRCYFVIDQNINVNVGAIVPKVVVYVFDRFARRATGVGLNLYDSAGALTFSTSTPPLNLAGTFTPTDLVGAFNLTAAYAPQSGEVLYDGTEVRKTLTASRKYAAYTTNMGRPRTYIESAVGKYYQESCYGGDGFVAMFYGEDSRALYAYETYLTAGWSVPASPPRPCFYIDVTDI